MTHVGHDLKSKIVAMDNYQKGDSMKKAIIFSISTFMVITTSAVLVILFISIGSSSESVEKGEPEANLSAPNDTDILEEKEKIKETALKYEDKVEPAPEKVEDKVVDMVHRMSHQKVRAEKKWGHLKITEKRLDEVIDLLEQYDVKDRTFLHKEMLEWKNGDFSNSVKVHNILTQPDIPHAVVEGKAYGLLSKKEEQTYIQNHFDEVDDISKEEDEGYQNRNSM